MSKIKLFTHTDLDGVGCGILGLHVFGDVIDVEYCDYHDINDRVDKFLSNNPAEEYDTIWITDISVDKNVATKLNAWYKGTDMDVKLLDHHDTAKWLNDYDWAYVHSEDIKPGHLSSGTSLLAQYIKKDLGHHLNTAVESFAEQVRRYDTWEWSNVYATKLPKELNDLLSIQGKEDFIDDMLHMLAYYEEDDEVQFFDETTRALLDQRQKEINRYIKKKNNSLVKMDLLGYKVGVVFAENYASELGNELCKLNADIDFVAIINFDYFSISFRTIRDDVHLGKIAQHFGGGGHAKAAGAKFGPAMLASVRELFLKER